MIKSVLTLTLLASPLALAGEYTVKKEELKQVLQVEAQAVPTQFHSISIDPEKWGKFPIDALLPQGKIVKKGDILVTVDTQALEKELKTQKKEQVARVLRLEKLQQEYKELVVNSKHSQAHAKLTYQRKKEDFDYAMKVTIPDKIADIGHALDNEQSTLDYYQDEFDQLKKMYEEDDLTEETEEIILKRSKFQLARAKRAFAAAKKKQEWEKNVAIPREKQNWIKVLREAKFVYESTSKNLIRNLKLKQVALEKEGATVRDWVDYLNALNKDLAAAKITSPVDGVVYYGSFEKGFWDSVKAHKMLFRGGNLPTKTTFMTVIPADAQLAFSSYVVEETRANITPQLKAEFSLHGAFKKAGVTVKNIATYPSIGGKWRVDFDAELPKGSFVQPGSFVKFQVVSFKKDNVLTLPETAVEQNKKGKFVVKVKLANGVSEQRIVTLGKVVGDKVEVLSGVSEGQVVTTP